MNILIIGTGYVGLVTGVCFADMGFEVVCVDNDAEKINMLKKGIIPIYENGLEEMLKRNIKESRISFTNNIEEAIDKSLFIFIAVGTPSDNDGNADLTKVIEVAAKLGKIIKDYKIIINESTVPIGTAYKVREIIRAEFEKRKCNIEFDVVSNPEFLKEGNAIIDFLKPDGIIIGTDNVRTAEAMKQLYKQFVITNSSRIIIMYICQQNYLKYASNVMLATRISLMNEIANFCDKAGADVEQVRRAVGLDSRIGSKFLFPGAGYGGSCLPKDVRALIYSGKEYNFEFNILESVNKTNDIQKHILFDKINNYYKKDLTNKIFAIWGLSFKPNTDDIRKSPALITIENLLNNGAKLHLFDPQAVNVTKKIFPPSERIIYFNNSYEVLEKADALILITEWRQFKNPDFDKIKKLLKNAVIFDGRNQYEPSILKELGFKYFTIGRDNVSLI